MKQFRTVSSSQLPWDGLKFKTLCTPCKLIGNVELSSTGVGKHQNINRPLSRSSTHQHQMHLFDSDVNKTSRETQTLSDLYS